MPDGLFVAPIDKNGHIEGEPVNLAAPSLNYLSYLQRRSGEMIEYSQRCVVY
jgi:hypothetical protein